MRRASSIALPDVLSLAARLLSVVAPPSATVAETLVAALLQVCKDDPEAVITGIEPGPQAALASALRALALPQSSPGVSRAALPLLAPVLRVVLPLHSPELKVRARAGCG